MDGVYLYTVICFTTHITRNFLFRYFLCHSSPASAISFTSQLRIVLELQGGWGRFPPTANVISGTALLFPLCLSFLHIFCVITVTNYPYPPSARSRRIRKEPKEPEVNKSRDDNYPFRSATSTMRSKPLATVLNLTEPNRADGSERNRKSRKLINHVIMTVRFDRQPRRCDRNRWKLFLT